MGKVNSDRAYPRLKRLLCGVSILRPFWSMILFMLQHLEWLGACMIVLEVPGGKPKLLGGP
jgi:hypothetical protein